MMRKILLILVAAIIGYTVTTRMVEETRDFH